MCSNFESTSRQPRGRPQMAKIIVSYDGTDNDAGEGAVLPGTSAQRMLTGGPVAVAIAPAGYRNHEPEIKTIGVLTEEDGDDVAPETAKSLAGALGATVADRHVGADLLV